MTENKAECGSIEVTAKASASVFPAGRRAKKVQVQQATVSLPEAKHRFKPPFANETDARVARCKDMPILMKVTACAETPQNGVAKNKQGAAVLQIQINAA